MSGGFHWAELHINNPQISLCENETKEGWAEPPAHYVQGSITSAACRGRGRREGATASREAQLFKSWKCASAGSL